MNTFKQKYWIDSVIDDLYEYLGGNVIICAIEIKDDPNISLKFIMDVTIKHNGKHRLYSYSCDACKTAAPFLLN